MRIHYKEYASKLQITVSSFLVLFFTKRNEQKLKLRTLHTQPEKKFYWEGWEEEEIRTILVDSSWCSLAEKGAGPSCVSFC